MTNRRAVLTHESGMRFSALTGTGRTIVFGDDTEINELSPVETVTVGLAACSAMDVAAIMQKKRMAFDSYTITVEGIQRDDYPQILTTVRVLHDIAGPGVTEAAIRRCIELSATRYCPVNAMLSAGATEIHHAYHVGGTGPKPFEAEGEVVVTGPYRRPDAVAAEAG